MVCPPIDTTELSVVPTIIDRLDVAPRLAWTVNSDKNDAARDDVAMADRAGPRSW